MGAGGTLRLFRCRPAAPAFDETIRTTILPDLLAHPQVERVWAARQGPDESGARVIASVWAPVDASRATLGTPAALAAAPEAHPGAGSPELEAYPILRMVAATAATAVGILRVSRGVLRDGDVERYADDVIEGVEEDRRDGHGPDALVLADAGERSFVTVSAWSDWSHIEAATGASIRAPIRTRRQIELASFEALHYELFAASASSRG